MSKACMSLIGMPFNILYSMIQIAKNLVLLSVFICYSYTIVYAQKKVTDLTLVYDATISTVTGKQKSESIDKTTETIYIKGSMSRAEMNSGMASFTSIHDSKSGTAVVLQEFGGQKLLIRMTAENWQDKNKRYNDISFINTTETKTIAGYKCTKATASTADGATFTVYYTKDIIPENADYNAEFKNLEGLPLEYELIQGNQKIIYTLSKINLNPVPASKFEIPKSGYRELSYEESRKIGVGG